MSGTRSMLIDSTLSIYTGVGSMSGTRSMPTDYSLQSTQGVHHSGMRNVVVARIHSGVGGLGRETWHVCRCTRIHQCCFSVNRADQIR